ncbi:MAG: ATP-binding protein [Chitinophagales bacterium]
MHSPIETLLQLLTDIPMNEHSRQQLVKVAHEVDIIVANAERQLDITLKDKTIAIQILNKTIEELKEQQQYIQKVNQDLVQQEKRLATKNQALEAQKEKLEDTLLKLQRTQGQLINSEKMASLGQLSAGIAHEINNPITFISSGVEALNQNIDEILVVINKYDEISGDNVTEKLVEIRELKKEVYYEELIDETTELLKAVESGAKRTAEIVKGLRIFSRLDKDVLHIADVHELLEATLIILKDQYKYRIEVHKDYQAIRQIECYPGKLNQVFMNILSNAIHAIEGKGQIFINTATVLVEGSDYVITIKIKDTGRGMGTGVQEHIFEPFYTTKDVGKGTGLGLSIVKDIINKHNGTIEVESEIGNGTSFLITLPIKQPKRSNIEN